MRKKKAQGERTPIEKKILIAVAVLCVLAVCVAGYGVWSMVGGGALAGQEEDPLWIRSFAVGDYPAEIQKTDGKYEICLELPEDFPFEQTTVNIELPSGAYVSPESNCYKGELGGRPIINMTVENASLLIENDGLSREYCFLIRVAD